MSGLHISTPWGEKGRRCHERLSSNKDKVAFWVKHGSIKEHGGTVRGGAESNTSTEFTGRAAAGPPIQGVVFQAATPVSGTVFWVKALPLVMTSFSRASFDWAVHFPQWMHTARPPLMLNVATDYSWLKSRWTDTAPINPASLQSNATPRRRRCHLDNGVSSVKSTGQKTKKKNDQSQRVTRSTESKLTVCSII